MSLEVGQVLWLKVKYQPGTIAKTSHLMLVAIEHIEEHNVAIRREKIVFFFNI